VFFFRLHVGMVPALLAPVLSLLVVGMPAPPVVARLTLDLAVFTLIAYLLVHRTGGRGAHFAGVAPLAYIVAKVWTAPFVAFVPMFGPSGNGVDAVALPGLALLLGLDAALVWMKRWRASETWSR